MAWDFETEPEFEAKLDWMREFVRDEIIPLEELDVPEEKMQAIMKPLKAEVKRRGLWAAHLEPELGGGGFGQVKLGLMHEILGQTRARAVDLRQQRARLGQRRAARGRRHQGAEEEVAGAAARRRAAQRVLDDRARGRRLRSQADPHARAARRRRVGDRRPQVVHLERVARRLPDHDGGDRSRRATRSRGRRCSSCRPSTPGMKIVRDVPMHVRPGPQDRRSGRPLRGASTTAAASPSRTWWRRGGDRTGLRAGAEAARPRPHPPRHALARHLAARLRHDVRARGVALLARLAPLREADGAGLGGDQPRRDAGGAPAHAPRRLEDGQGRRVATRATRSR